MQFTCDVKEFLSALDGVAAVIRSKVTIPILSHVRLDLTMNTETDGLLKIGASNLDQCGQVKLGVSASAAGSCAVDAVSLKKLLSPLTGEAVFKIGPGRGGGSDRLLIRAGRARGELPMMSASELNLMESPECDEVCALPAEKLAAGLRAVEHCQRRDDARPHLNGVNLSSDKAGVLTLTASDGARLASVDLPEIDWPFGSITLPIESVRDVVALCGRQDKGKAVSVGCDGNTLRLESTVEGYQTKLIEGEFPNWRRLLDLPRLVECTVVPGLLENAAAFCISLSNKKSRIIGLRAMGDGIDVQSGDAECEAETRIDADLRFSAGDDADATTDPREIVYLNGEFLRGALSKLPRLGGRLILNGDDKAVLIESEDKSLLQLLQPARGTWRE